MDSKKQKCRVHVRAIRTRIMVPNEGEKVFVRGDIIKKPWPELIKAAELDTKHRVLRLEILKDEEDKKK